MANLGRAVGRGSRYWPVTPQGVFYRVEARELMGKVFPDNP